jgi:hypothetical protein
VPSFDGGYDHTRLHTYPQRGGKLLRPCLCLAAAVATGGSVADALPTAVAIELMHNALLVHDDIQDGSDQRRGRPTLHALHGVPLALNAGDALGLLSLSPLKANATRLGPALIRECRDQGWVTGDNEPYDGHLDGDSIDRHALQPGRPNVLIEVRNDLIADENGQTLWASRLAPILQDVLAATGL